MDFIKAIRELRSGDRMRRPEMGADYINMTRSALSLVRHGEFGSCLYCPTVEEILADNWELLESFKD